MQERSRSRSVAPEAVSVSSRGLGGGNSFDPFDNLTVGDVGIGHRFLPDSIMDEANDHKYLIWIRFGSEKYTSQYSQLFQLGQMIPGTDEFDRSDANV